MSTKLSQDELRKLMKQKRENLKSQKIDSPFAKYNSSGQLSCIACNVVIKSNNLWVSHVVGKCHKENLLKGKKSSNETSKNATVVGTKRPSEQSEAVKKLKTEVFKVPEQPAAKPAPTTSLLAGYSSSDDSDDDTVEVETKSVAENSNNPLPSDFFDNESVNGVSSESNSKLPLEQKESTVTNPAKSETLPEGFFDDPILDAKARNIEYKDPIEEEWERFQRSIAEETNVSKTIIAEDLEESVVERGIHQLDEQIHKREEQIRLESLADVIKSKVSIKEEGDNQSEGTDDDLDEDDLLDWRSKSIKKV